MIRRSPPASIVRLAAMIVLIGGVCICVINLFRLLASREPGEALSSLLGNAMPAIGDLLPLIGLAGLLTGLAMLIEHLRSTQSSAARAEEIAESLQQIKSQLDQLPLAVDASLKAAFAAAANDASADSGIRPAVRPASPNSQSSPVAGSDASLERMVKLLEDIRELSMMNDAQRQAWLAIRRQHRKNAAIADAVSLVRRQEWGKAGRLIAEIETEYPNDADVAKLHESLTAGRGAAEGESFQRISGQVEDMMAISSWDQAYDMAARFAENFPDNHDGQFLLARVTRERDLFKETTVQTLYEEIKNDVERRQWRRALAGAQRLLERFPDHKRALKIRDDLRAIQDNAEIEHRQEMESRIQELIRAKRFGEAIELAEDLLGRFPLSPQAESLEELLPKMRELAVQQEMEPDAPPTIN